MNVGRYRLDADLALRFAAEGSSKATALLMAILLARWLAADGFGAYSQTQALVAVLVPVALLGLGFAVIRHIAGAKDTDEISAPVVTALIVASMVTLPAAAVMWLFASELAVQFSNHPAATELVRTAAVLLPVAAWQSLIFEALRARQRVRAASALQIGEAALTLFAMILLFVVDRLDPVTAVGAVAALKFIFLVAGAMDFLRSQAIGPGHFRLLPLRGIKAVLALGIPFMIAGLGEVLMGLGDRVLVGSLAGADTVGRYAAAQTLVAILASWGAPYWWLLYPRMARAMTDGSSRAAIAATHRLFGNFIIWATPLAVMLALLGSQILTLAVGDDFLVSGMTVGVLVFAVFVNQATTPWEYFLYISGRAIFLMWVSLAWGAAAIAGILILLPELGLLGPAVAVAAARAGFAFCVVAAAGHAGAGLKMLPSQVTVRAIVALLAGAGVTTLIWLANTSAQVSAWYQAAAFVVIYLLVSLVTDRLQARRRSN